MKHRHSLSNAVHCLGPKGTNASLAVFDYGKMFLGTQNFSLEDSYGGNDFVLDGLAADDRPGAFAVVPIENSSEGPVVDTLRWWKQAVFGKRPRPLPNIIDEVRLPVRHCFAIRPRASARGIRRVISHPQALAQCSGFLKGYATEDRPSTAAAAREVGEAADDDVAAVCSEFAAECYGLKVVARDIHEKLGNETRFHVVSRVLNTAEPTGADRTALIVELANVPGAIHHATGAFASHGVNVSMLQSLPLGSGRYGHYFEVECHREDGRGSKALTCLRTLALDNRLFVLGSYPRAELTT